MPEPFASILQQALASGSRSTVLKPLGWLVGLTLTGAIAAFKFAATMWFSNTLGVLCVLSILLYIIAYIYFALTDKDALRSEKYSIQKLAIQKGFIGDDQTGYITINNEAQRAVLPAIDPSKHSEEGQ